MSWLANRRARRDFEQGLRITALEKSTGLELSHPELDLPKIRVVRNPNGFAWQPWVAVGFPGEGMLATFADGYCSCQTYARSRNACVRAARERLWQIALAKAETPTEVNIA